MFTGSYAAGSVAGNDFAAMPRLIQGKPKFKDPYGQADEYFPQNISHDRRVMRGSTYAAMVIPAGTNPDAMVMDKSHPKQTRRTLRKTEQAGGRKRRNIYPNRDIPSPEPVPGRRHMDIQTLEYKEILTDKPPEQHANNATEFYLDRPPVPLFHPRRPDKANCKETQIYEGDHELFDFNAEVEPMLNVLCSKTLEQARMEVLEETELAIIKSQQKEYEEQVNAELIIAQRYEAAEERCKAETDRRKRQNDARKLERRAAHQKLNARQIAKGYLGGLREMAFGHLTSAGVLVQPPTRALREEVVPWLMQEIMGYLKEDAAVNKGAEKVVVEGIAQAKNAHKATIKAHFASIEQAKIDKEEAKKMKEVRREQRKIAREKAKKDATLQTWIDEVREKIIHKGQVEAVFNQPLVDITGNFQSNYPVIGAYGGHMMQLSYVVDDIIKRYHPKGLETYLQKKVTQDDEEYFARANNLAELVLEAHLMPFIMSYLKDMKTECIEVMVHPKISAFMDTTEANLEDLSSLTDDQVSKFKELFKENRVSAAHKNAGKSMDMLYDFLVDILAKRVPVENVAVKVDQINGKVKLIEMPEGLYHEDTVEIITKEAEDGTKTEEKVEHKQNTEEAAVIVLRVPQIEKEEEIQIQVSGKENEDGEPQMKTEIVKRFIDEDQQDKVLCICNREVQGHNKNYYVITEYAGKAYREDFIDYIAKNFPEFFEDNDDLTVLKDCVNQKAKDDTDRFIKKTTNEYEFPCMVFPSLQDQL